MTNSILRILVFSAAGVCLLISRKNRNPWLRVPGFVPFAAFLIIAIISTFFTRSAYSSIEQILFLLAGMGAYAVTATLSKDMKTVAWLIWAVVISSLGICLVSIRDYAITTGGGSQFWKALLSSGDHLRLFGTFVNPGFFAGFLVVAIPVTLGVYLVTRRSSLAALAGMSFVFETMALMLTGAKFGIISSVVSLLVFFTLAIATGALKRARFKRILIIALVITPLLILFSMPVRSRIVAAEEGGSQVHSTNFRLYTWKATVNMIRHSPWIGVGPGCYDMVYPRYTIAGPTKYAHQSYLQMASESGVFALAAFVAGLLALAWSSIKRIAGSRRESAAFESSRDTGESGSGITWKDMVPFSGWRLMNCAVFSALVGSVLRNMVDSDWYVIGIWLPFWILAGVLAAQSGAADKTVELGKPVKAVALVIGAIAVLFSISFGLGDFFASDPLQPNASYQSRLHSYQLATAVSPLNPDYHRELGKCVAATDTQTAKRELETAILLAPADGKNYFTLGLFESQQSSQAAIRDFNMALRCNPNSTQALYQLAQVYISLGDTRRCEATYKRLIGIENSLYEQVKGAPELVDTTYAFAHDYFGGKCLGSKDFKGAAAEYKAVVDRLVSWRSNDQIMLMARVTGLIHPEEEKQLLEMLRDSYYSLAKAYKEMGYQKEADRAQAGGDKVQPAIDKLD